MENPILLIGTARSGLGIIAEVLYKCGGFGGDMAGVNIFHSPGYFENVRLREGLLKPVLRQQGIDPNGQFPIKENRINGFTPVMWREFVELIMQRQGLQEYQQWFYNDFRSTILWLYWHEAFPQAKWVYVRRSIKDIVLSCMRTGYMTAYKNTAIRNEVNVTTEKDGWIKWVGYYTVFIEQILQTVPNSFVLDTKALKSKKYSNLQAMIEWAGLTWNDSVVGLLNNKIKE